MKKIIFILLTLPFFAKAQDSTILTIPPQARDLEFIGSFIYNQPDYETLYDTTKSKFRVANPATGTTTITITAYSIDWYNMYVQLNNNPVALKTNCTSRIATLLRATLNADIIAKLDAIDVADGNTFQSFRQFGRNKLRKQ